jgi:hypothetical protein
LKFVVACVFTTWNTSWKTVRWLWVRRKSWILEQNDIIISAFLQHSLSEYPLAVASSAGCFACYCVSLCSAIVGSWWEVSGSFCHSSLYLLVVKHKLVLIPFMFLQVVKG